MPLSIEGNYRGEGAKRANLPHWRALCAVVHFAAMNATRSHLSSWACALLLLVLLNGLACGIGHGQMMSTLFLPLPPAHGEHASMDMDMNMNMHPGSTAKPRAGHGPTGSEPTAPMPGMHSLFSDCFFAASLPLGLLLFSVLGWLLRHRTRRLSPLALHVLPSPRFALPGLNPRAP